MLNLCSVPPHLNESGLVVVVDRPLNTPSQDASEVSGPRGTRTLSTTLENEAIATLENEATQTDWVGDLSGGLGVDPSAGGGRGAAASGRADLGIGRSTVERAVASDRPPKYERRPVPTSFAPFEPRVRAIWPSIRTCRPR